MTLTSFCSVVLALKLRALHILGTELCPQLTFTVLRSIDQVLHGMSLYLDLCDVFSHDHTRVISF
jgi:hypothetical protein